MLAENIDTLRRSVGLVGNPISIPLVMFYLPSEI